MIVHKTKIIPTRWLLESYYNNALSRFKVQFEMDSDLIAPFEIDDIEVQG